MGSMDDCTPELGSKQRKPFHLRTYRRLRLDILMQLANYLPKRVKFKKISIEGMTLSDFQTNFVALHVIINITTRVRAQSKARNRLLK